MPPTSIATAAQELWDYHNVDRSPTGTVNFVLALGSHDVRVAEEAARLFVQGLAPWLVASGGSGKVTGGIWTKPEALVFRDIAVANGVDPLRILVETDATNTGDNITKTRDLLEEAQRFGFFWTHGDQALHETKGARYSREAVA